MTDLLRSMPTTIVQAQLDAYNAHDVPALLAIYADDAQQFQHPDTLLATGQRLQHRRHTVVDRFDLRNAHQQRPAKSSAMHVQPT